MKTTKRRPGAGQGVAALATMVTAAVLAGCGGGGGSSPAPAAVDPPASAPASTQSVPVSVIDGAIANAVVCLDLNDDGACDAGEPTAKTGADGKATLDVPIAEAGKHAVVAQVGTDAVDADHGPVTVPFVLKAPADQPAVVSPLTTLVQAQAASTGSTTAEAEAYLRSVTGLSVSLLTDYTQAAGGATSQAGTLARLVVLATQQQTQALAPVVGTPDLSGTAITRADVTAAVTGSLIAQLPALSAAAVDPAVTGATDRAAALATAAQAAVADAALTPTTAAAMIGVDRLAAGQSSVAAPAAGANATTRIFQFTDASNWAYRTFLQTAQDATLDASGRRYNYDLHARNTAGTLSTWGFGIVIGSKDDLHWNGSAWVGCALGQRSYTFGHNAAGTEYTSNYCDGYSQGSSKRSFVDIAGKSLRQVVEQIRTFPGGDSGILYADYGPADLSLLGADTFPAGSLLSYQTYVSTALPAVGYTPGSAAVLVTKVPIAAGGDARTGSTTGGACSGLTTSTPASALYDTPATLEALVAGATGKPCVYNPFRDAQNNVIDPRNEWFGSTVNAGSVAGAAVIPAGSGTFYSTTAQVRIGFNGQGNGITWFRCLAIAATGSIRNCDAIGTGTYAIATLGDARIMTFTGAPPLALQTNSERVFVERGGVIRAGYRNRAGTFQYVNLNLTATNALFTKLGVPVLVPQ